MDVIEVWSGRHACLLQSALRLTNEQFAARLGIAVRTVAAWHADPAVVPRKEMQQLLDTVHEKAPATARQRFTLLVSGERGSSAPSAVGAQALRVAIAVVIRESEVLLVCRRDDDATGLSWQFPAGVIKPGAKAETATVRETLDETGVHCAIRQHLGNRLHPVTGVLCEYFLCEYLAGQATNSDAVENIDVMWVPRNAVTRFIPVDTIFPPVLAVLEEQT
ncbi:MULTISPECIES: NUDIX hydrolase [unclassified Streptomyces]|uniref:NUDIX hydrolase n=1 Tax=unclassified Streptomyces TaxID=2593676 RepID=UPI00087EBF6D|nr:MULTISPECIES: NUDIX hydrolase [unclassified Streptomyces]PBC83990.1 8-oxo-dGTP diphosphatase [Streptomyces sp. 2321.6]SDR36331.1 8-oxo-dGTP diphosphatase [Streptomyces sp. KS_16]SED16024.1 8-oxo-dGTP diphosphatase [Streptomyces sp. 2133.1]SNC70069.1 8-oxo-dGTP diphosphatase [Streptomyces sp. 2114.4]